MSDDSIDSECDKQTKDGSTSDQPTQPAESSSDDTDDDAFENNSLFSGVDDVDTKQKTDDPSEQENNPTSDQQPAATAINELAEGESLTEVLTVALKEWREMQQISRKRDEAEYKFQRSIIKIGASAFIIVILVSGLLSYTGNLPGSSFAFILGTLFGSLATLLQSFLRKQQPEK